MSVIFGAINLSKQPLPSSLKNDYLNKYDKCIIDKYSFYESESCFVACGIQYFTEEAKSEIMPIYDSINNLIFVSDCYLTNRTELLKTLGCENDPDGTLIYKSYLKWKNDFVNHIRGSFSIMIFNTVTNEVELYADHFSTRCLFYHIRNNVVYFSTLLFPMIYASGLKYKENERWLVDTLSLISPVILTEPCETAYKDVFKVPCGYYIKIGNGISKKHKYYNPVKTIKVDNSLTKDNVRDLLHKTLGNSIRSSLRSSGKIGIKLSSGLDSTSIAGFAAKELDTTGSNLYSYTSIPLAEANVKDTKYFYNDETSGVLNFCQSYPNIVPSFIDCKELNILDSLDTILTVWELPCKSQQNAVWTSEINKQAYKDGCRILLSGATGNCTLSSGYYETYIYDLMTHLKFIKLKKALRELTEITKIPSKKYIKMIIKDTIKSLYLEVTSKKVDVYKNTFTSKDIGEKYDLTKRFSKKYYIFNPVRSRKHVRNALYLEEAYAQIGEVDTKESVYSGVLQIDPLRDVDFINFCCTLPIEYFADSQNDRRLVREFLDDIVPDFIRNNIFTRGVQSGDNTYRISKVWDAYKETIKRKITNENSLYIDTSLTSSSLDEINNIGVSESNDMIVRTVVDCYSFCKYLELIENIQQ